MSLYITIRELLWDIRKEKKGKVALLNNQFVKNNGIRREFFHEQIFDFSHNRRPSPSKVFQQSKIGDFIGPGIVFIDNLKFKSKNLKIKRSMGDLELVWGPHIPFNSSIRDTDLEVIMKSYYDYLKNFNSYREIERAKKHLENKDVTECVRSCASSIDALLRYYCYIWEVDFPRSIPFNDKIDEILSQAGKPIYSMIDPENSTMILYLYRARNSMHEGDCYYIDNEAKRIEVRSRPQANKFLEASIKFVEWIKSIDE